MIIDDESDHILMIKMSAKGDVWVAEDQCFSPKSKQS